MVASTNVRATVDIDASQPPKARLSTVNVGKTQTQIISASWWRLGGGVGAGGFTVSVMGFLSVGWRSRRGGRGYPAAGGVDVVLDELGVDRDGDRGSFAGGGDHLRARIGGVAGRPHSGHARAAVRVDLDETSREQLAAKG